MCIHFHRSRYGGTDLEESEYAETFERGPDGKTKGFGNARGDQGLHNDFGNNTVRVEMLAALFIHAGD